MNDIKIGVNALENSKNLLSKHAGKNNNRKNALELLKFKEKKNWIVEVPRFFFMKKRIKIFSEDVKLLHLGDLSIIVDSSKGLYMGYSRGHWCSFTSDK